MASTASNSRSSICRSYLHGQLVTLLESGWHIKNGIPEYGAIIAHDRFYHTVLWSRGHVRDGMQRMVQFRLAHLIQHLALKWSEVQWILSQVGHKEIPLEWWWTLMRGRFTTSLMINMCIPSKCLSTSPLSGHPWLGGHVTWKFIWLIEKRTILFLPPQIQSKKFDELKGVHGGTLSHVWVRVLKMVASLAFTWHPWIKDFGHMWLHLEVAFS